MMPSRPAAARRARAGVGNGARAQAGMPRRCVPTHPQTSGSRLRRGGTPSWTRSRVGRGSRRDLAEAAAEPAQEAKVVQNETYEVNLKKPFGVSFGRGNDGMTYVSRVDPKKGNIDPKMQAGDKVLKVSASFGPDVWEALNYGQVAYAIRTRNGDLYMELLKRNGDLSCFDADESDEATKRFKSERAGGNYGEGTRELQNRNYRAAKESASKRQVIFNDGLQKFRAKQYKDALMVWEDCLGMEPKNYLSDRFETVTEVYKVTAYNIACCYSKMGEIEAGLSALDDAMNAGFEDYNKIRSDPNLAELQKSEKFDGLIDRYDESVINTNAINAIKKMFSFGKDE